MVCENEGIVLYENLQDKIFGAKGKWGLRQCTNKDCGLVWQNPMIAEGSISEIYNEYYTHQNIPQQNTKRTLKSILKQILKSLYNHMLCLLWIKKIRRKYYMMGLERDVPGKLLEIGAGDGSRLLEFKKNGWDVIGQEIDSKAIGVAKRKYNIQLLNDQITDISLSHNSFDAIIMNHVLEHLLNPLEVINKCHQLLKPNGQLIFTTPNTQSLTHKVFRRAWRGLEPPRHLYLFNISSLRKLMEKSDFLAEKVSIDTFSAEAQYTVAASMELRDQKKHNATKPFSIQIVLKAILFQFSRLIISMANYRLNEFLILKAFK